MGGTRANALIRRMTPGTSEPLSASLSLSIGGDWNELDEQTPRRAVLELLGTACRMALLDVPLKSRAPQVMRIS